MTALLSFTSDRSVKVSATDFFAGHGLRRLGKQPFKYIRERFARIASYFPSGRGFVSTQVALLAIVAGTLVARPDPFRFGLTEAGIRAFGGADFLRESLAAQGDFDHADQ